MLVTPWIGDCLEPGLEAGTNFKQHDGSFQGSWTCPKISISNSTPFAKAHGPL